jgi:protein-S-isoprenylcysteine O-methyltransferase Ste14
MLWTGYFLIKGTVVEPFDSIILTITGLLMVSVGVIMTFWCRRQMRHSWSAHTVVVQNHHLIENGPYRCIRHPIYAFASLMSVGTILVFPVWWNTAAGIGMVVLYVMKSYFEERMLVRELSGYLEYRQKVRYRFFPGIW